MYITILNALKSIPKEDDRWIIAEKIPENTDNTDTKRSKVSSHPSYRTVRMALSYSDIYNEYNQFINHLTLVLSSN
jgi:hypothetical protein